MPKIRVAAAVLALMSCLVACGGSTDPDAVVVSEPADPSLPAEGEGEGDESPDDPTTTVGAAIEPFFRRTGAGRASYGSRNTAYVTLPSCPTCRAWPLAPS